jgi:A/G-specific adenine glycosylase
MPTELMFDKSQSGHGASLRCESSGLPKSPVTGADSVWLGRMMVTGMQASRNPNRRYRSMVRALLRWWESNRREFPWRRWTDLYRLLVSEVLLRQTRADTVAAFVAAFLDRYPNAQCLASADVSELAATLRPLGFSTQRAAQLRELATRLDRAPATLSRNELIALPGIGRYSSGMVAAVGGERAAAVDTNVARVICRVFGLEPSHAEARKSSNVWAAAQELVAGGGPAAHVTWALLDLAASICLKTRPRCDECPLRRWCAYAARAPDGPAL